MTEPPGAVFERTAEIVRNGFLSPHALSGVPGRMSGCAYRQDGSKVALSERYGGHMGDYVQSDNPDTLPHPVCAKRLPGRCLYLGHYMGPHYGHFITETLSTFWIFQDRSAEEFDRIVFHPFVFGTAVPEYARHCFAKFGFGEDRISIVGSEAIAFDELVVPERLFRLNHSADSRLRWVYHHIARDAPPQAPGASRLYLSRRRFSRTNFERVVANEVDMEAAFQAHGFRVIYPEALPFEDQVALYARADAIAGISGSGLHNSLFMPPDTAAIELGDPRYGGAPAPTQALCNSISGVRPTFIPFKGRRFGRKGTMLFDIAFLREQLDLMLGQGEPSGGGSLLAQIGRLIEVGYLCLRPMGGALARQALSRLRVSD